MRYTIDETNNGLRLDTRGLAIVETEPKRAEASIADRHPVITDLSFHPTKTNTGT